MTARVTRAENILNSMAKSNGYQLSETGKDFLIANLDPFHDTQLKELQGWPDVEVGASVVRCVKKSITVTATSGGGPAVTAPWDCHISMVPCLDAMNYHVVGARNGNTAALNVADPASSTVYSPFGGLVIRGQFTSGQPVVWMPTTVAPSSYQRLGELFLDYNYSNGLGRLIGVGFEVHDVTAEISKQGTCTVYCQSEPRGNPTFQKVVWNTVLSNTFNQQEFSATTLTLPPTTVANAMTYPGSRQWKSAEGAYLVGRFHSNENPPLNPNANEPIWLPNVNQEDGGPETNLYYFPVDTGSTAFSISTPAITINNWASPLTKIYPFHNFGCIFSGLNPVSALTVNVIYYYESFPTFADQEILVLATPSAQYDPVALEILSHSLSRMPVGVKVKENFLGEWFSGMVNEMKPFLQAVIPAVKAAAIPLGAYNPALGAIAYGAAKAGERYLAPPNSTVPNGKPVLGGGPTKKQKKKIRKMNQKLAAGSRQSKRGTIQGPLRK